MAKADSDIGGSTVRGPREGRLFFIATVAFLVVIGVFVYLGVLFTNVASNVDQTLAIVQKATDPKLQQQQITQFLVLLNAQRQQDCMVRAQQDYDLLVISHPDTSPTSLAKIQQECSAIK